MREMEAVYWRGKNGEGKGTEKNREVERREDIGGMGGLTGRRKGREKDWVLERKEE